MSIGPSKIISLPESVRHAVDSSKRDDGKHANVISEHQVYIDALLTEHANGHLLLVLREFRFLVWT